MCRYFLTFICQTLSKRLKSLRGNSGENHSTCRSSDRIICDLFNRYLATKDVSIIDSWKYDWYVAFISFAFYENDPSKLDSIWCNTIVSISSVTFFPVTVGVITFLDLLKGEGMIILLIVFISTFIVLVSTARMSQWLIQKGCDDNE